MPTRVPTKKADNRVRVFTGRIKATNTEKSRLNAIIGWLMAEYYKIHPERREHWTNRLIGMAREMNQEARQ